MLQLVLQHLLHVVLHLVRVKLRIVWHLRLRQHLRKLRMQRLHGRHNDFVLPTGNSPGGYSCADHGTRHGANPAARRAAGPAASHSASRAAGHRARRAASREIANAPAALVVRQTQLDRFRATAVSAVPGRSTADTAVALSISTCRTTRKR